MLQVGGNGLRYLEPRAPELSEGYTITIILYESIKYILGRNGKIYMVYFLKNYYYDRWSPCGSLTA